MEDERTRFFEPMKEFGLELQARYGTGRGLQFVIDDAQIQILKVGGQARITIDCLEAGAFRVAEETDIADRMFGSAELFCYEDAKTIEDAKARAVGFVTRYEANRTGP